MTRILLAALGVFVAISGVLGWFLWGQLEANGKLKESNAQLQATVNAQTKAVKGRAQTDDAIRKLPPAAVLDRLK